MSNDTGITPALTADEWQPHFVGYIGSDCVGTDEVAREGDGVLWFNGGEYKIDRPHAAAALCLYGQPFGFTRADVAHLRVLADRDDETRALMGSYARSSLRDLADRIAALLPPDHDSSPSPSA